MLKFINTEIVFQEIPDETTLAINISNCPCHCPDCHSQFLWEDTGTELTAGIIDKFMETYGNGITCLCFMGGDAEPEGVDTLAKYIKGKYPEVKTGWYSGRTVIQGVDKSNFDYIKIGPYIKHLGPLNAYTTNQRLYKIEGEKMVDITYKFWRNSRL
jgi:anaerobic ribonucleoside-triphosphate reductase activating protein